MRQHNIKELSQKPLVNIFWTGGWDSTFRIVSLARKEVIIQPYYLKDKRKSEWHELNAIQKITEELLSLSSTKCKINELVTMETSQVEKNAEITEAYNSLLNKCHLGSQYDWLARFAKKIEGGVELSIEKDVEDDGPLINLLKTYGKIKINTLDKIGSYYVLDSSESPEELIRLFGNFHFPLLNKSKINMKRDAENSGYIDIMNMTWFCNNPINDMPCGICRRCDNTIKEGMAYRFSNDAIKRYKLKRIKKIFGLPKLKRRMRLLLPK